jgi:Zn-finger nucleic acid-binding protein
LVPFAFPHTPEVRLDACRECKGVWLDDGELDALAARIQRHRTESKPDPSDEGSLRDRTRAAAAMLLSAPCPNCRTANPAGSVTCFRCGSRTEGSSAHGLCPRCDRRLGEMPTASLHLRLEGCRACGGVWFAEGRLAVFLRLDRESVAAAQKWTGASGLAAMPGNLSGRTTAYCPGCHFPMERRPFAGGQSVEIDRCANCEGVWLDGGELMSLHRYLQVHGVPEATTRADAWGEGA